MTPPKVEIPNGRMAFTDVLTGGQPSPAQLGAAQGAGYRTIINLRPADELKDWDEADRARALGLNYVSIPIAGAGDLTEAKARALADALDDIEGYPVMVHCGSGNRVGALFALKAAWIDGEDIDTALEIGRRAGLTSLEPVVRERLQRAE